MLLECFWMHTVALGTAREKFLFFCLIFRFSDLRFVNLLYTLTFSKKVRYVKSEKSALTRKKHRVFWDSEVSEKILRQINPGASKLPKI